MGKAIVIGVVIIVLALILAGLALWFGRQEVKVRTALTPRQERQQRELLDRAATVLRDAGAARTIEDSDILSHRTMKARDQWLDRYNQFTNKETNA